LSRGDERDFSQLLAFRVPDVEDDLCSFSFFEALPCAKTGGVTCSIDVFGRVESYTVNADAKVKEGFDACKVCR